MHNIGRIRFNLRYNSIFKMFINKNKFKTKVRVISFTIYNILQQSKINIKTQFLSIDQVATLLKIYVTVRDFGILE